MKDIKEVNIKELKEACKDLNDSGLLKNKLRMVGLSNAVLLKSFTDAIEAITDENEDVDIPNGIAEFYNSLLDEEDLVPEVEEEVEDPEVEEEGDEIEDPEVEEEGDEIEDPEVEEEGDEIEDPEVEEEGDGTNVDEEGDPVEPVTPAKPKKEKKAPVIRSKSEKKVPEPRKRAEINSKLSLAKKVKNILNFKDGLYKQTTYFPIDCENIRILETNPGLYPPEIIEAMKSDKKVWKKVEKFSPSVLLREINKVKSVYSYIVGAIHPDRADSKLSNVVKSLLENKEISKDVAHYTTVKIARRALLAYLDVTGVDYSVLKDVRKELVKKASKEEVPVASKKKEAPAPKQASKKEESKLKPAKKPSKK
jgi:hypothetical protein